MTTTQFNQAVNIISVAVEAGAQLEGLFKQILPLIHPDHTMTDAEINSFEGAVEADDKVQAAKRAAMAKSDE
jgi:hypothetical protein